MALRVTFSRSPEFREGNELDEHQAEYVCENDDVVIQGQFWLTVYVDGAEVARRYYGQDEIGDYECWQLYGSNARYDMLTINPA